MPSGVVVCSTPDHVRPALRALMTVARPRRCSQMLALPLLSADFAPAGEREKWDFSARWRYWNFHCGFITRRILSAGFEYEWKKASNSYPECDLWFHAKQLYAELKSETRQTTYAKKLPDIHLLIRTMCRIQRYHTINFYQLHRIVD